MRRLVLILAIAALFSAITLGEENYEQAEKTIEKTLSTGIFDGHLVKQLRRLGDAGAIAVGKAISDKNLSKGDVELVLTFLQDSFSSPDEIQSASDRAPRLTFLLLRYLDQTQAQSTDVKNDIAKTRQLLQKVAAEDKTRHSSL